MSAILLTGATGNVTSAVIRSLQGSGHRLVSFATKIHSEIYRVLRVPERILSPINRWTQNSH
jgi:nucleoside-diphosphate-sugar epimerase